MSTPFQSFSLNLRGRLYEASQPLVMGIINVTPDSFFDGSRRQSAEEVAKAARDMVCAGADILDLGACSTRPGAETVTAAVEIERLRPAVAAIRGVAPEIPVSIDTFHASVARAAIEEMGADIVNDISGGDLDPQMWPTIARLGVPYIIMHMRGTPADMQTRCDYGERGVTAEVIDSLSRKIRDLRLLGVADIIADPGLGFAKTVEQNYELLRQTPLLVESLDAPILIGLSRKSMLTRPLGKTPAEALAPTVAANTLALAGGASIIRVHDVAEAVAARDVVKLTYNSETPNSSTKC